ncbi:hypothetical protein L6452_43753 [Arctium lappa]|uniref:Uncharacterized protein n=1 Tax=Arctium lappa TaxID=4217 RepID=A0ACB8XDS9_ARCLA|nr:hypothetical protein L6452_43753 [Arctium lappa]
MEISEKLLKFLNILAYFWPLLLSTALFLLLLIVFGLSSPLPVQVSGEKAGEGILDYVVGRREPVLQPESEEGISSSGSKYDLKIMC